jgi:hypothetical protein
MPPPLIKNPFIYPGGLPSFDLGHPASQGIAWGGSYIAGNTTFTRLDQAQVPTILSTGLVGSISSIGKGLSTAGNGVNNTFTTLGGASPPSITAAAIFTATLPVTGFGGIITNSSTSDQGLEIKTNGAGFNVLLAIASGSLTSAILQPINTPLFIAASWRPGFSALVQVNLSNGITYIETLAGPASTIAFTTTTILGNDPYNDPFSGNLACAMLSAAYLTPQQLLLWANEPWRFWYPDRISDIINLSYRGSGGGAFVDLAGDLSPTITFAGETANFLSLVGDLAPSTTFVGETANLLACAGDLAPSTTFVGETANFLAEAGDLPVTPAFAAAMTPFVGIAGDLAPSTTFAGETANLLVLAGDLAPSTTFVGDAPVNVALVGDLSPSTAFAAAMTPFVGVAGDLAPSTGFAGNTAIDVSLAGNLAPSITFGAALTVNKNYFFAAAGNDSTGTGSVGAPYQSLTKANTLVLNPGDAMWFNGGDSFSAPASSPCLTIDTTMLPAFNAALPITIGAYGTGNPTFTNSAQTGIYIHNVGGVTVQDIILTGGGGNGNTYYGVDCTADAAGNPQYGGVTIQRCTISAFNAQGILIFGGNAGAGFSGLTITGNIVHDCPSLGINIGGPSGVKCHANLTISNNHVYNIVGIAGGSFTGSGIACSNTQTASIFGNTVHDCGTNSNQQSGPVGIWASNSDSVTIRNNEVYSITTSYTGLGGGDADGIDADQGATNTLIEYNYVHGCMGAGILQYNWGSVTWGPNTVRYNVLQGNGQRTNGFYGEISIGAGDAGSATAMGAGPNIYQNTCYSATANPCVALTNISTTPAKFYNNIFISNYELINVGSNNPSALVFQGNNYSGTINYFWNSSTYSSYAAWQTATGQEKNPLSTGSDVGKTFAPGLVNAGGGGTIGYGNSLNTLTQYQLLSSSALIGVGLNLSTFASINDGGVDFFGNTTPHGTGTGFNIGAYGATGVAGATVDLAGNLVPSITFGADLTFFRDLASNLAPSTVFAGETANLLALAGDLAPSTVFVGDAPVNVALVGDLAPSVSFLGVETTDEFFVGDLPVTPTFVGETANLLALVGNLAPSTAFAGDLTFFQNLAGDLAPSTVFAGETANLLVLAGDLSPSTVFAADLTIIPAGLFLTGDLAPAISFSATFVQTLALSGDLSPSIAFAADETALDLLVGDLAPSVAFSAYLSTPITFAGNLAPSIAFSADLGTSIASGSAYGRGPYGKAKYSVYTPGFQDLAGDLSPSIAFVAALNVVETFVGDLAPSVVFASDFDINNVKTFNGNLAPTVTFGASLSVNVTLVGDLSPSIAFSCTLTGDKPLVGGLSASVAFNADLTLAGWQPVPPAAPPWQPGTPCPPSIWTPVDCAPIDWEEAEPCRG